MASSSLSIMYTYITYYVCHMALIYLSFSLQFPKGSFEDGFESLDGCGVVALARHLFTPDSPFSRLACV